MLNDINQDYDTIGKADSRLSAERDGRRGCGGIGLLWHKSTAATPISGINLDRICGIRIMMDDGDRSLLTDYSNHCQQGAITIHSVSAPPRSRCRLLQRASH